jgi:hypothetical protein
MPPVAVDSLSPSAQIILSALGFIVAVAIYFYGLLKRPASPPVAKDVVLPNINVMDSMAIREAAEVMRRSLQREGEREAMVRELRRGQQEQTELLRDAVNSHRDIHDVLERIEKRLKRETERLRLEREE